LAEADCFDSETSWVSTWANLASNSLILRRLVPIFLRRSGNSQSCRSLVQVPHFGLTLSHFNFRFRHDTQEMVFSGALVCLNMEGPGPDG
jgi:hypothetical protein